MPALPLLNTTIVTTDGVYEVETVTLNEAKEILASHGNQVDSAIGHQATADILTTLLGVPVPVNRQQFQQQEGQTALVLKLNTRAPEGVILSIEEIEDAGYTLKAMTRTR